MPAQMVHLAIARIYAENKAHLYNNPEYYLGSIVPDAMHMRKTPDSLKQKDAIHFKQDGEWRIDRLKAFFNSHKDEAGNTDFLAEGYVVHILSDYYWWTEFVNKAFKTLLESNVSTQERMSKYYYELGCIEYILYDKFEWRPAVWSLLETAKCRDIDDMLTADEIHQWKKHTFDSYNSNRPDSGLSYLSEQLIISFINETASKIKSKFLDIQVTNYKV